VVTTQGEARGAGCDCWRCNPSKSLREYDEVGAPGLWSKALGLLLVASIIAALIVGDLLLPVYYLARAVIRSVRRRAGLLLRGEWRAATHKSVIATQRRKPCGPSTE
jgi:hypothetical protein